MTKTMLGNTVPLHRLYFVHGSPFSRKARIAILEKGVGDQFEWIEVAPSLSPLNPKAQLDEHNPLGKVPTLITSEGEVVIDSRVIVEYLDQRFPVPRLLPQEPQLRLALLQVQALADGIIEASIAFRYESTLRPIENRSADWCAAMERKIEKTLERLNQHYYASRRNVDAAAIALACALGYLDYRLPHLGWRSRFARLRQWHDWFSARNAYQQTDLRGKTWTA